MKKILFFLIFSFMFIFFNIDRTEAIECCKNFCTNERYGECNGKAVDFCNFCTNPSFFYYQCPTLSCGGCSDFICNGVCTTGCTALQDPDCNASGCCGDGICNGTETYLTCPSDCPAPPPPPVSCGDGICNGTETHLTCPSDCPAPPPPPTSCGDGICNGTETHLTCPTDCPAPPPPPVSCGDGICNGTETYLTCPSDCPAPPPSDMILDVKTNGNQYKVGDRINIELNLVGGNPNYSYVINSSIDGKLLEKNNISAADIGGSGLGFFIQLPALSVGNHIIIITFSDSVGATVSNTINFGIIDSSVFFSPINNPSNGKTFSFGENIYFSTWPREGSAPYSFQWKSDKDGIIGTEQNFGVDNLSIGDHTIALIATDADGKTYTDSVSIKIKSGLNIAYISPGNTIKEKGEIIYFSTYFTGNTDPTNLSWTSSIDGLISSEMYFSTTRLSAGRHTITLLVEDSVFSSDTRSFIVDIKESPCVDNDGDGYGKYYSLSCPKVGIDCNDNDPNINPGATEICGDKIDNNCSGRIDDCPIDFEILEPSLSGNYSWGDVIRFRVKQVDTFSELSVIFIRIYDVNDKLVKTITLRDDGKAPDNVAKDFVFTGRDSFFEIGNFTMKVIYGGLFAEKTGSFSVSGSIPTCEPVHISGDPDDKYDIVFVADQFDSLQISDFINKVEETKDYILNIVPFKENASKINIHRVDSILNLDCGWSEYNGVCNTVALRSIAKSCSYDNVVVLANNGFRSFAVFSGFNWISANKTNYSWITLHELGHSFGKLQDEYIEKDKPQSTSYVNASKNCDTDSTCSKWSDIAGTGCFDGCLYNLGYYRSINSGTMRSINSKNFGTLNIMHLNKIFDEYN